MGSSIEFPDITFKGTLRPSQEAAVSVIQPQVEQGEKKLHIVAPPGSGKTILGLYVWAELLKKPALVLSPNSAIQAQWLARTSLFDLDGHEDQLSLEGKKPGLLTSLTYQSVTMPRTKSDTLDDRAMMLWAQSLILKEESTSEEQAMDWIASLASSNKKEYERNMKKYKKAEREVLSQEEGILNWLNPSSKETIEELKSKNIGLVIFDECHHLTEHWGEVLIELIEYLGHPFVLGLTATPPDHAFTDESNLYKNMLGEIDYEVPIPALVRESNLSPYQDLCYFVRPTLDEIEYISKADEDVYEILDMLNEPNETRPTIHEWILETMNTRTLLNRSYSSPEEFLKKESSLSSNLSAWFSYSETSIPYGYEKYIVKTSKDEVVNNFEQSLQNRIMSFVSIIDYYTRYVLIRSTHETDHQLAEQVKKRMRLIGVQISDGGATPCASPVSRILAYSKAKTDAVLTILGNEYQELKQDMRAVIVTDYEKTSSTAVVEGIHDNEVGGAISIYKALVADETTDLLNPVLMTGSTVFVDDDLAPTFIEFMKNWIAEHNLNIEIKDELIDGFHQIHGSGKDWAPRYYSTIITEFFQLGHTQCLVGTRGLLGEGWDASRINVLLDLTSVTTNMSINQLRGRSIRLDKLWPEKVANNWDVICLAEEFIKGYDDYTRFKKKHVQLYGVCDDGSIEKGVAHVHSAFTELKPEVVNESMGLFNQEMLERSKQRMNVRELWGIGKPFAAESSRAINIKPSSGFGIGFSFGKNRTALKDDILARYIAMAISRTMWDLGMINNSVQLGGGGRGGGWLRYYLKGATQEQAEIFTTAMHEAMGPLDDARYVIDRSAMFFEDTLLSKFMPEVIAKYIRKKSVKLVMYHRIPTALCQRKKDAKIFQVNWNEHVSPGIATYVKNDEGKRLIKTAMESGLTCQTVIHENDVYI